MASRSGRGSIPALRWFNAADVANAMPDIDDGLRLAELTMTALARPEASQLPSKIGVHPRPEGAFVHAMPAHLRGAGLGSDLVGMKWVAGFGSNVDLGIPAINAIVVLNDPATGVPTAILDGGPITAQRTAAVSGLAISRWSKPGSSRDVALIGAGVQGHSHVPVVGHVLPGTHLHLFDRDASRVRALAETARSTAGIAEVTTHESARAAVEVADVIISAASFAPAADRQVMTNAWLKPGATVVPIDYATYCSAEVARDAALFLVDEREQFLANREDGQFDEYPDPGATIGEAILAGTPRPEGRVVITHLGVGLADLVFADAVVRAAEARGLGMELPR